MPRRRVSVIVASVVSPSVSRRMSLCASSFLSSRSVVPALPQSRLARRRQRQEAQRKATGIDSRVPWTTSRVKGTPEPPPAYRTEVAFPKLKFAEPLELATAPGSDRLFIAERRQDLLVPRRSRQGREGRAAPRREEERSMAWPCIRSSPRTALLRKLRPRSGQARGEGHAGTLSGEQGQSSAG